MKTKKIRKILTTMGHTKEASGELGFITHGKLYRDKKGTISLTYKFQYVNPYRGTIRWVKRAIRRGMKLSEFGKAVNL
jgi:hypothetical protein